MNDFAWDKTCPSAYQSSDVGVNNDALIVNETNKVDLFEVSQQSRFVLLSNILFREFACSVISKCTLITLIKASI